MAFVSFRLQGTKAREVLIDMLSLREILEKLGL